MLSEKKKKYFGELTINYVVQKKELVSENRVMKLSK